MNYFHFLAIFIFAFSALCSGVALYHYINIRKLKPLHRVLFFGEVLLFGGSIIVGEFMVLAMTGLYNVWFLWGVVLLNMMVLLKREIRTTVFGFFQNIRWSLPAVGCIFILGLFSFRNCYFLIDIDSHSTYLNMQKLWLHWGSCFYSSAAIDARIHLPHFDSVPHSLGISLFGLNTLFPQLVILFWRLIVLMMVYGYVAYRFNGYYALGAMMMVAFNDHFFYAGANQWVLVNGALIALLFGGAYNFWEAKRKDEPFYLVLAALFFSQLMANKYQMFYLLVFLTTVGLFIQQKPFNKLKILFTTKNWVVAFVVMSGLCSLWYIKNTINTGLPTFPILAGHFGTLGWSPEKSEFFMFAAGGISPAKFFKYASYFFIWPGIKAAKIVGLAVSGLPLILLVASVKSKEYEGMFQELCYWLGISFLILMGTCLASHQDPRYYRFGIAINAVGVVFAIHFIFTHCLRIKTRLIIGALIFFLGLSGITMVKRYKGSFNRSSPKDNLNVLLNKLHMDDIIARHYPDNLKVKSAFEKNVEKLPKAAWNMHSRSGLSTFLQPIKPQVGFWYTSIVHWDSYDDPNKIIEDIKAFDIEWIMDVDTKSQEFVFLSLEEYAQIATKYNRFPETIGFPYDMPAELIETKYTKKK